MITMKNNLPMFPYYFLSESILCTLWTLYYYYDFIVFNDELWGIPRDWNWVSNKSVIKLGQKEPRPIRTFTVRATLTRSVETKIGLSQRKKSKYR